MQTETITAITTTTTATATLQFMPIVFLAGVGIVVVVVVVVVEAVVVDWVPSDGNVEVEGIVPVGFETVEADVEIGPNNGVELATFPLLGGTVDIEVELFSGSELVEAERAVLSNENVDELLPTGDNKPLVVVEILDAALLPAAGSVEARENKVDGLEEANRLLVEGAGAEADAATVVVGIVLVGVAFHSI